MTCWHGSGSGPLTYGFRSGSCYLCRVTRLIQLSEHCFFVPYIHVQSCGSVPYRHGSGSRPLTTGSRSGSCYLCRATRLIRLSEHFHINTRINIYFLSGVTSTLWLTSLPTESIISLYLFIKKNFYSILFYLWLQKTVKQLICFLPRLFFLDLGSGLEENQDPG
jgi:hypothetical protein